MSTTSQSTFSSRHHSDKGRLLSPIEVITRNDKAFLRFRGPKINVANQSRKSHRKESSPTSNMPKLKKNGRKTSKKKENGDALTEKLLELSVPAHREIRLIISGGGVDSSQTLRYFFRCAGSITIESTPIPKTPTREDICSKDSEKFIWSSVAESSGRDWEDT